MDHRVVSREAWLEARKAHLKSEKALTRMRDLVADWVRPRTMYGKGGMVERSGRYHAPDRGCLAHE